eukprot:351585-Chlamydomonas_euryale.AAC.11
MQCVPTSYIILVAAVPTTSPRLVTIQHGCLRAASRAAWSQLTNALDPETTPPSTAHSRPPTASSTPLL